MDLFGKISEIDDACGNYWFKSTAIEGQYIYDVGSKCKASYHNKAIINSNGDLYFEGNFEEFIDDMSSWDNFTVTAIKLSPTQAEIKNHKTLVEIPLSKEPLISNNIVTDKTDVIPMIKNGESMKFLL